MKSVISEMGEPLSLVCCVGKCCEVCRQPRPAQLTVLGFKQGGTLSAPLCRVRGGGGVAP